MRNFWVDMTVGFRQNAQQPGEGGGREGRWRDSVSLIARPTCLANPVYTRANRQYTPLASTKSIYEDTIGGHLVRSSTRVVFVSRC